MEYESLINRFIKMCRFVFGEELSGVYLHGSLAMDCFNANKSDIDLIITVKDPLPIEKKAEFIENVTMLNYEAPVKGIETSVVLDKYARSFVYPTPFETHFSISHLEKINGDLFEYAKNMTGTDKDLAAHFTVIKERGKVLFGEPIESMFGNVPKEDYIDSIFYDIENAKVDIKENPVYVILNLARVLAFVSESLVLSKKEGGEWGIKKLPETHARTVKQAYDEYTRDVRSTYDNDALVAYADYMLNKIKEPARK